MKLPSQAASAAHDADTVLIDPGEYFDCAVWPQNTLTIAGAAPGVVITDKPCEGKALFVLRGTGTTVRDLTLARARVPDGNGAGIRAEGANLTVTRVAFINNQAGLLANGVAGSVVTVSDSVFTQNGGCGPARCVASLQVGAVAQLRLTDTRFSDAKGGDLVVSQAARTELSGDVLADGEAGASRFLLDIPSGAEVVSVQGSRFEKGPHSERPDVAVMLGEGSGFAPGATLRFAGNTLENHTGQSVRFILNWSAENPVLAGNVVGANDTELSSGGLWWHRARAAASGAKDTARAALSGVKQSVKRLLGRG